VTGLPPARRRPLVARLAPTHPRFEEVMAAHDAAVRAGAERYVDPATGFGVFTAAALWARGECCTTGCRHCPFEAGPRG
jgi:hypothetical protein